MINSKQELCFYIMADRIMNGLPPQRTLFEKIQSLLFHKYDIAVCLRLMRYASYYKNKKNPSLLDKIRGKLVSYKYSRLSQKLGFCIGYDVFGYGLFIPHYGTIVVNSKVRAGNYCVLHTSTCVGGSKKVFGDGLYMGAGAKIMGTLTLGNWVSVAANSLVNKSFGDNVLLAGMPAIEKRNNYQKWYERDGGIFLQRFLAVEELKNKMFGNKTSI